MSAVAIITARGGSKRIPRKNVRPFLGRPIIAYSIEAALACRLFDEVMVSTDDEEIAAVARDVESTLASLLGIEAVATGAIAHPGEDRVLVVRVGN